MFKFKFCPTHAIVPNPVDKVPESGVTEHNGGGFQVYFLPDAGLKIGVALGSISQ